MGKLTTELNFRARSTISRFEQTKILVVKEISKEEGKTLVETYFKEHGTADIEELMINLHITVQTLVEIIDELRNEGKLVPHEDENGKRHL